MTSELALKTDIKVIGVVGAGIMGHGIAQVALQSGLQVLLQDLDEAILKRARERIAAGLAKGVRRGRFSEDEKQEMLKGLVLTITPLDLSAADFVIEAVTEDLAVKRTLFQHLDRIASPEVILATNTSSLPITKIASATSRPSQIIGMHFFNPVPLMPLVEVIRGLATADATVTATVRLAERLGKTPVLAPHTTRFIPSR